MIRRVVVWQCVQNGVFSWGEKGLMIDNEKCISCGKCEEACMVSAIKVARSEEEYQKITDEEEGIHEVELYNEESIMCLLSSIPIKEIADTFDESTRYRKIEVKKQDTLEKYGIKELPSLLFFRDGKLIKKYEGYVEEENKKELLDFIKE